MAYAYIRYCNKDDPLPIGPPTPGDCVVGSIICSACEGEYPIDDYERRRVIDEAISEAISEAINWAVDEAVKHEREECVKIADERDNYWNTVAYDQRQAGKSDIDASARAGSAMVIASAIRARQIPAGQYRSK